MKAFIIVLIVLGIWLAYKKNDHFSPIVRTVNPPKRGSAGGARSTLAIGNGAATNLSNRGSATPGSGIPATQPALRSTWGIGGDYNIGYTAPTWAQGGNG